MIVNWKRGFRRITFVLAIAGGIFGAGIAEEAIIETKNYEHNRLLRVKIDFEDRWGNPVFDEMREAYVKHNEWFKKTKEKPSFDEFIASLDTVKADIDVRSLPVKFNLTYPRLVGEHLSDNEIDEIREKVFQQYLADKSELSVLERGFWVNLSSWQVVGLRVLASVGVASAGFCAVWLIYYFIEWLILGFCADKPEGK